MNDKTCLMLFSAATSDLLSITLIHYFNDLVYFHPAIQLIHLRIIGYMRVYIRRPVFTSGVLLFKVPRHFARTRQPF